MQYVGSKNKISKQIVNLLMSKYKNDQTYIEPFVGGCNLIDKLYHLPKRIGNDANYYLIEMWRALQKGWIPPVHVSEEEYLDIRANWKAKTNKYSPELMGYVGFCTFGSNFMDSYPKAHSRNPFDERIYYREHYVNVMRQVPKLEGVIFENKNYLDLDIPEGSLVYCDPPYEGTIDYLNGIDHSQFWDWIRGISKHSTVFVSEYKAPDDFECILEIPLTSGYRNSKGNNIKKIEKVFRYTGGV